jgi:hypothetical protein
LSFSAKLAACNANKFVEQLSKNKYRFIQTIQSYIYENL